MVIFTSIDEYILQFPADIQKILQELRKLIKEAAPEASEKISWGMPTFYLHGNLVHFAANKKHIGLYPGANGVEAFKNELLDYKFSKGAIQFPFEKPIPRELVIKIVKFKVQENIKAAEAKVKNKR